MSGSVACSLAGLADAAPTDSAPTDSGVTDAGGTDQASRGGADTLNDVAGSAACGCLKVGTRFRFTAFALTALAGDSKHLAIGQLNAIWKKDIGAKDLNFYAEVTAVTATQVELRIVSGARIAGTADKTCLLPGTAAELVHGRSGCALSEATASALHMYAGTLANPKHCSPATTVKNVIPIAGAKVALKVADDCSALLGGTIEGAVAPSELAKVCMCLLLGPNDKPEDKCFPDPTYSDDECAGCSNLASLITALSAGKTPAAGCDAGPGKGICINATFEAQRIATAPPACD